MYIVGILRWPGGTVLAKRRNPTHADAHTSFVNILHWCDFALCNLLHKNIRLGCRNLRRHSQLQTRWTHIFFFFAFSMSSLLVALSLPCGKPVGLPPYVSKGIIFHVCLRRLVLERNKTYDREIALWNAGMRIYFDANVLLFVPLYHTPLNSHVFWTSRVKWSLSWVK